LTAKDYLLQIPALRNRIAQQCALVDDYLDEACRATSRIRAVAISGTGHHSRVETYMDKLIDLEREKIDPLRQQLWQIEQDVLKVTAEMPEGRWRQVIEMRYLRGMEWKDIASEMGVHKKYVFQLHGHALIVYTATHNKMGLDLTLLT
jgi:DNA-directed RNA polymerase specialized sigma subunit